MTGLLRAEVLRLGSTRSLWLLAGGALALIAGAVTASAALSAGVPGSGTARSVLALAGLAQTAALLAGTLIVTGEYRHRTITVAVLLTPRRTRLLAAKLLVVMAAGLLLGALASGMAASITLPLLAARHLPAGLQTGDTLRIVIGGGLAGMAFAGLGVGLGALIRHQVGAIVAIVGLLYVAEPLLGQIPQAGTAVQRYGLGGLSAAATQTAGYPSGGPLLGQPAALLLLAVYAGIAVLAGAALLRHRDVTA